MANENIEDCESFTFKEKITENTHADRNTKDTNSCIIKTLK